MHNAKLARYELAIAARGFRSRFVGNYVLRTTVSTRACRRICESQSEELRTCPKPPLPWAADKLASNRTTGASDDRRAGQSETLPHQPGLVLAPDECESDTQLKQELPNVFEEPRLQFTFLRGALSLRSPALLVLTGKNLFSNAPVKEYQLRSPPSALSVLPKGRNQRVRMTFSINALKECFDHEHQKGRCWLWTTSLMGLCRKSVGPACTTWYDSGHALRI